MLVDDVLSPAPGWPESMKLTAEILIPVLNFTDSLSRWTERHAEKEMEVVRASSTVDFSKFAWNNLDVLTDFEPSPASFFKAPLSGISVAGDRADVVFGNRRHGARFSIIKEAGAFKVDDVTLVADYNQGLTLGEALDRCRVLDAEGLSWIEEPLRYDDLDGHARLAADLATPVMLGENFYGPRAMYEAIRSRACDLVMPDLMRIGGVTGWLQAAAIADVTGLPMSSHLYPEVSGHLLRVTPTGQWLEWQDWAHPVLARPFDVRAGQLHLPDVPGNGLEWDEGAVAHFQADQ